MICIICKSVTSHVFTQRVLKKFNVSYFKCKNCDFIFTEKPFWLKEAYRSPINVEDTGILQRNNYLVKRSAIIAYFLFGRNIKILDYSGGYGIATRMFRDLGFDSYWDDPMARNIFAQGFSYRKNISIDIVTAFECFEHFVDPLREIAKIVKISKNIIFSTELLPKDAPDPEKWWYYGFNHGQHVSFYSQTTLKYIARKFNINYYFLNGLHLFTTRRLNILDKLICNRFTGISYWYIQKTLPPRTYQDMQKINHD